MVPSFMKASGGSGNAWMSDLSRKIRDNSVFRFHVSSGPAYIDMNNVMELLHNCLVTESMLETGWQDIYGKWTRGEYGFDRFKEDYLSFCNKYFEEYLEHFASFLQ